MTGQSVRAVARESYALTLYTFLQLEDSKRLRELMAETHRLDMAGLVAIAFHEPKKLSEAGDRLKRKANLIPSRDEAIRRALELLPVAPKKRRKRRS